VRNLLAYIAAKLFAQQLLDEIQPPLEVDVVMVHGGWRGWRCWGGERRLVQDVSISLLFASFYVMGCASVCMQDGVTGTIRRPTDELAT
jgi:hypothetical protein